jgi:hypothetical protein
MANILEFLRNVLTENDAQTAFRADPVGYLQGAGFADLTGEDVVEGVAVLRGSLTEHVASGLDPFVLRVGLPAAGPVGSETELDAAIRMLFFAVDRVPPPEAASQAPAAWPETVEPADAAEAADEQPEEFVAADAEPDSDVGAGEEGAIPPAVSAVTFDMASLPSVQAFAATLEAAAAEARETQVQHAREVADRLAQVLPGLHGELEALRTSNETTIARLRAEAEADREASRTLRAESQAEADALLERAHREADELLEHARTESESADREIATRRAELREAEEQLRERLSGIDSLFRRVLGDDAGTAATAVTPDTPQDAGEPSPPSWPS